MSPSLQEFAEDRDALARLRRPTASPYTPVPGQPNTHPQGWEPGVAWDGTKGTITSRPLETPDPQWEVLLRSWGFDPALYEVVEPVQVRTWDAWAKNDEGKIETRQLWYHRASIKSRSTAPRADVEALTAEIRRHKPSARPPVAAGGAALLVALSDWQIGKAGEEGGGTPETVQRLLRMIDDVEAQWKALQRQGVGLGALYAFGLGDLIENCDGHYPMQAFNTDLDRREQVKVARRILTRALTRWARLAPRIVVAAVPGNHGENRKDGKAFTTFGDNDDVALVESVAEVLGANPEAYSHVSFVIPQNELAITLDVAGTVVALAHGHQARTSGPTAQAKVRKWWEGQAFGNRPAGDARLLFSGHFHHLSVTEVGGGRTHFQAPAQDGGSGWFTNTRGENARTGTLTVVVGPDGWDHLRVL